MSDELTKGRNETEVERLDRNLDELLAELRVALPGVQVLFAFLLILPFNARFAEAGGFVEAVYLGTLISTALASLLLIAPSMHHRLLFRTQSKAEILTAAHWMAIVGLSLLAVAMAGAVLLVTEFVFSTGLAAAATALVALVAAVFWFVVPFRTRLRKAATTTWQD